MHTSSLPRSIRSLGIAGDGVGYRNRPGTDIAITPPYPKTEQ